MKRPSAEHEKAVFGNGDPHEIENGAFKWQAQKRRGNGTDQLTGVT
jgi:hypothetical protein